MPVPRTVWPLDLLERAHALKAGGLTWRAVAEQLSTPEMPIDQHRLRSAASDAKPSSRATQPYAPTAPRTLAESGTDTAARQGGGAPQSSTQGLLESLGRAQMIAILADLHVPEHDEAALQAFEAWAQTNKPDEIILDGDVGEFESASRFSGVHQEHDQDIKAVGKVLDRLRRIAPTTYRQGNHDVRAHNLLQHNAPTLASSYSLPDLLRLGERGIVWSPEGREPLRRGRLMVVHGHEFVRSRIPPLYHARLALDRYAEPDSLLVYGHVHHEQVFRRPMLLGNARAHSLPCMRTLTPDWVGPEIPGWELGFGVAYVDADGAADLEVVSIRRGAFRWGGRRYAA